MSKEALKLTLEAAYLAGWNASGEGYNAEYPFGDHARNPEEDAAWIKDRDNALQKALAEQPAPVHEMTPEMMRKVQMHSELGAYAAANLSGAYDLFAEFWRVAMSAAPQPAQQEQTCTWARPESDFPDTWESSCGVMWTFDEGGPKENGMRFCHKCGKKNIESTQHTENT
jgi:hypothetical protein